MKKKTLKTTVFVAVKNYCLGTAEINILTAFMMDQYALKNTNIHKYIKIPWDTGICSYLKGSSS